MRRFRVRVVPSAKCFSHLANCWGSKPVMDLCPISGGTPYNGLYGETSPKRGALLDFRYVLKG